MTYYSQSSAFNKGEISPLLASRSDIDSWASSLKECTNFHVLVQGGIRRRSGTMFVTEVANSAKQSRLLPFIFNSEQAYVLDVNGGGTIRFVSERAYLLSGASPYAISHPWAEADLFRLSTAQANDVMYVAHKSYAPRKINRMGDINWSIADAEFNDGPYLPRPENPTTLKPAARGSLTPIMMSNTTPSGTVVCGDSSADAYKVFDGNKGNGYFVAGSQSGNVGYMLPVPAVADAYWLATTSDNGNTPINWVFEGYDGTNWIVLDTRSGESGWARGETRFYEFDNNTAFEGYRINWNGVDGGANSTIAEFGIHERAEDQTPFNLTASSTSGINDGVGFTASDVGRSIRLYGADGRYRWFKISSRTSSLVVKGRLYGHALPDTSAVAIWRLGSFSDQSGWPGSVTLYDERLMFARTDTQPVTVFGSKQSIFDDYGISEPSLETDGLSLTLLSSNMNEILWIVDDDDLVTGSSGQIRSIGPADFTKSFSAVNLTQKKGPTNGAFYLQPITIGGVVLYVAAGGKKIRELVLGDQNRYVAPDLSVLGEHMLKSGIVDWAFAENPDPTIYAVNGDGELVAIAYDRDQKVVGFSRFEIAGGFVESVAVVPGVTAGIEDVYLVVRRTINGQTKRYIEVLDDPFDGSVSTVEDAFFVDCGLKYAGAAITTVNGLGHLEGEDVTVLADGGVVKGLTVTGGSITLPYAASKISVGLAYKSRAVTLPVSGPQQDGSIFGRRVNVIAPLVDVLDSGSLKAGPLGGEDWSPEAEEQIYKDGDGLFGSAVELASGFQYCQIEGSWADGGGSIVMETDEPLPLLIRSVVMQLDSEP